MKNNGLRHIRTLYLLFAGILILCLVLFLSNVLHLSDHPQLTQFPKADPSYAFRITDLESGGPLYQQEQVIEGTPAGIKAHTHINRFDVDIFSTGEQPAVINLAAGEVRWVMVLQWISVVSLVVIFVLVVIVLFNCYQSARRGQLFPKRNTMLLTLIGVLLTLTSLMLDTSAYIERCVAVDLLQGTVWQPSVHFNLHFTRIFFGLTLIFLAQIFRIGRQMQEDQELTI